MSRKKKKCLLCDKEVSLSNYDRHHDACKGSIEKDWFINKNGDYECKICGKKSTKDGIGNHIKYHYGYKNPNLGRVAWNLGLTKNTSEVVKRIADTYKENLNNGKTVHAWKGKKHSEETKKKWKENPNMGGLRLHSGRGIQGWYRGFYCRSTWELAWLVFQLDNEIEVKSCSDSFEYEWRGEKHKYHPDFIVDENYIEIKGFRYPNTEEKIKQFPSDRNLILIEGKKEIKPYIEYVEKKYGKYFWKVLYQVDLM